MKNLATLNPEKLQGFMEPPYPIDIPYLVLSAHILDWSGKD